ncbi:hypothetical protein PLEOSDRAFT_1106091 [Pleurotus ostreatus PC15]|uniref:Helicase C-terminal domain-containing protein n=1 Tax=Pleurotus ostreatus (strain PC15) TaxID=1137138 RepID=A0A067NSZ3_PLEO1|nr:hypothetical protein PLEOSDRAFT_1106091 [Pleurotus ostreatus PC15]
MPSSRYSATFLAILTTKFQRHVKGGEPTCMLEDKTVLKRLGLSTLMTDKFKPPDLSFHQVQLIKSFIEIVMKKPNDEKVNFVINHADCTSERKVYGDWFRERLAPRVNALVESAMRECGYHPQSVLASQEVDDFPSANLLVNACLTPVAVEMFGEVVMSGDVLMDAAIAANFKTMLIHNVSRMGKAYLRAGTLADEKVKLMRDAVKAVEEPGPQGTTLASIRAALQASKNVERLAGWYPNLQLEAEENIVKLKEAVRIAAELPRGELDTPVRSKKPKANEKMEAARKKARKIHIMPAEMADAMEVARTMQAIATHLELAGDLENCPTEAERHAYASFADEGDLGVEVMSKKTVDQLCVLLSFAQGRPGNWNGFVRDDGATAWHLGLTPSNPAVTRRGPSNTLNQITLDMFARGGPGFKPISLLWHQLVGVAAIVANMFFGDRVTSAPMSGVLLADGVGVGKTAQVMATIAFLQQVELIEQVEAVRDRVNRPPIIRNMPWFMGMTEYVPNEPHLIVVPLSLVAQWKDELYRFFSRGSVDIFQLPNALGDLQTFFTNPDDAWLQSQQKMINRIVICAHSTFQMMAGEVYIVKKARGGYVDGPRPLVSDNIDKLVFGIQWCTAWIDEAHLFRGAGRGLTGVCQLHECARVTHVITATPLFTKIQDIINMARMCNHDEFVLSKGQQLERQFNRDIRAAKREMSQEEKDAVKSRQVRALRGDEIEEEEAGIAVRFAQYSAAKVVQAKLAPHLIRRTLTSVDLEGKPLNTKMPPITEHVLTFKLSDREMENLGLIVDEMESSESGVPANLSRENFFLPYRCGITFFKGANEDWPVFDKHGNSKIGHYDDISSTKLDLVARLVLHLLSHDEIEHPMLADGQVVFPPPPPPAFLGQRPPRKRKVLIYHEFSMMAMTIETVFRMKGIGVLVLNGLMNKQDRERVIDDFVHSDAAEHRVLLFSSIGAVGLNLTCADTVIMLDMIWSQVGTEQIIGRAARLTQENAVHVYHLVALGTTDVLMSTMAREKGEMLATLFSKEKNEKLEEVFYGISKKNAVSDSDQEEDDDDKKKKKKALPKTRTARGAAKNAGLESISRSQTPSISRASKTPTVEEEEQAAEQTATGGADEGAEQRVKGKAKPKPKPATKRQTAAKPRPKPKAKGRVKSAAEVHDDNDAGPSEPPTAEGSVQNEPNDAAGPSRPPTVGASTPNEPSHAAGPSRLPAVGGSTPNAPSHAAGPSWPPVVGGGIPNRPTSHSSTARSSGSVARPSGQPAVAKGAMDVDIDEASTGSARNADAARPSRPPMLLAGPANPGAGRPSKKPMAQTTPVAVNAYVPPPSQQPVAQMGLETADVGRPSQRPAPHEGALSGPSGSQRQLPAGWVATQPASQRPLPAGWVATQPASQADAMEIDHALQRASPPPMDVPMDVDVASHPTKRAKRPAESKVAKSAAVDPLRAAPGLTGPPWTQANPTTPPRAGSKHRPNSSPELSPRTERRQSKTARRGHHSSSDEANTIEDIAMVKQEGEPSQMPLYNDDNDNDEIQEIPGPAGTDEGEDFASLLDNVSEVSESSDDGPLAARQVQMAESATAQHEEVVPRVNLPAHRPPRGRGRGGRARGRK